MKLSAPGSACPVVLPGATAASGTRSGARPRALRSLPRPAPAWRLRRAAGPGDKLRIGLPPVLICQCAPYKKKRRRTSKLAPHGPWMQPTAALAGPAAIWTEHGVRGVVHFGHAAAAGFRSPPFGLIKLNPAVLAYYSGGPPREHAGGAVSWWMALRSWDRASHGAFGPSRALAPGLPAELAAHRRRSAVRGRRLAQAALLALHGLHGRGQIPALSG